MHKATLGTLGALGSALVKAGLKSGVDLGEYSQMQTLRGKRAWLVANGLVGASVVPISMVRLNLGVERGKGGVTVLVVEHRLRRGED